MKPVVIVNFKSYRRVLGRRGATLARLAAQVADERGVELYVAPQLIDTSLLCEDSKLQIFAQHCDAVEGEARTGRVTLDCLAEMGAKGLILNHSEYPQTLEDVAQLTRKALEVGLKTCLCVPDLVSLSRFETNKIDFIAIEPPELIGGNLSVSRAKPDLLLKAFEYIDRKRGGSRKLCGAGIKTAEDVKIAKQLGAEGILVSSGVVLSDEPVKALDRLISGFFW
jgi:triosephosphate isomerase